VTAVVPERRCGKVPGVPGDLPHPLQRSVVNPLIRLDLDGEVSA
jgi:hypothetical protein